MLKSFSKEYSFTILIVGVFLVFSYFVSTSCEKEVFDPAIYLHFSYLFFRGVFGFLVIAFLWQIILNFDSGLKSLSISAKALQTSYLKADQLLGVLFLMVAMPVYFSCYTTFKIFTNHTKSFDFDPLFKDIDYYLHLKTHPWAILHQFLANENTIIVLDWIYSKGWFIAWGPIFIWMAVTSKRETRWVFFATFMLSWLVMGTFIANLFPSAGPCYFDKITGDFGPYSSLFEYLDNIDHRFSLASIDLQKMLWQVYLGDDLIIGTGISAMPSMHISMMTTCALGTLCLNRILGCHYVLLTLVFLVGSVYLGWHYAIDGYVSIILTCIIWYVCTKISPYKIEQKGPNA